MKKIQGMQRGMGIGGWLTNYKRFNVLPVEKRLHITIPLRAKLHSMHGWTPYSPLQPAHIPGNSPAARMLKSIPGQSMTAFRQTSRRCSIII